MYSALKKNSKILKFLDPPRIGQWGSMFMDFWGFPLPTNLCPYEPITKYHNESYFFVMQQTTES